MTGTGPREKILKHSTGWHDPFEKDSGSDRLLNPIFLGLLFCIIVVSSWLIWRLEIIGGLAVIMLPGLIVYLYFLFRYPITGLYTAIGYGFIVLGLGKYISGIPLGTLMDAILIMTYIALFFNRFRDGIDLSPVKKDITFLSILWFGYTMFELVNPEAGSSEAWFSGRGVSLYMLLIVPLTLLFINTNRKLDFFFYFWGAFSLLATFKGMIQHFWGVDQWERAWLNEGNYKTHILFGHLRSFSFMSDAGQFGANQAYTALVAVIFSMSLKEWKKKLFFIIVAVAGFYGLIISGTRGAISVPLAGFMTFLVLRKNLKVMLVGLTILMLVFVFLKFTSIGQGNYQIRRMRTALDPKDASFQVRLENQRRLRSYLASRPFGGGIGLGGVKAQRFRPNAFLSQVATDSWYVLIWVEQGIVGLFLHLLILFYVIGKASLKIMFRVRDPALRLKMSALASGMAGVMVASYGNAVLGQMPTCNLLYASMAIMMHMEIFDKNDIAETGARSEVTHGTDLFNKHEVAL